VQKEAFLLLYRATSTGEGPAAALPVLLQALVPGASQRAERRAVPFSERSGIIFGGDGTGGRDDGWWQCFSGDAQKEAFLLLYRATSTGEGPAAALQVFLQALVLGASQRVERRAVPFCERACRVRGLRAAPAGCCAAAAAERLVARPLPGPTGKGQPGGVSLIRALAVAA